ncbi:GNAT family N-acetyltransferase [Catellatospora tritici]|uniref:GNAT family N-acetyltransferase n=1 Tax=Catellatospora tritici TaxID=2851566 RepID=UPI001C2CCDAC|nr:GNAT family N-acetyltransferase [Catellatospora tritici]MBV1851197.1 GNAT family N-acetyltransferase [Catellatospora tritici]
MPSHDLMILRRAATADLSPADLAELRDLLDHAYDDGFDDEDWRHALGGTHVLGRIGGDLVAHAAVRPRTLWLDGTVRRTGYVEAVAVAQPLRGRGLGTALMAEVADVIAAEYELGGLCASAPAMPLYLRLGWQQWPGPTHVRTDDGPVPTPEEDGAVFVLLPPGLRAVPGTGLGCDWRDGDVW